MTIEGSAALGLLVVAVAAAAASLYGYIENIIKLIAIIGDPLSAMEVLRGAGIVIPFVGVVLGYF